MNLMTFASLLQDEGIGVMGGPTNTATPPIYINMMPAEAETAILLRSPLSGTKINYELVGYYKTEFQIIVRGHGHSYVEIEALMAQVIDTLTVSTESLVDTMRIKYCRPRTEPVVFPLSNGNLLEFNVMFDIAFSRVLP